MLNDIKITHEKIAELKEAFRSFDKDDNGRLGVEELISTLKGIGRNPSSADEETFLRKVLPDSRETIDFPTFATLMGEAFTTQKMHDLISESLNALSNETGKKMCAKELQNLLSTNGKQLSEKEAQALQNSSGLGSIQEVLMHGKM